MQIAWGEKKCLRRQVVERSPIGKAKQKRNSCKMHNKRGIIFSVIIKGLPCRRLRIRNVLNFRLKLPGTDTQVPLIKIQRSPPPPLAG